ncbi:MAG: glutamate synthase large subunit, partial [Pseudomonadota bacterium]
ELDDLDLNPVLTRVDAGDAPKRSARKGRQAIAKTLDEEILSDAAAVFERREKMQMTYTVKNTDRSIGARTSSAIVRRFGADGLPDGHLTIRLAGSAGQSLGVFAAKGLRIELDGDANDYVGKGLSGADIIIRPFKDSDDPRLPRNAVIGNTCLFGATSGTLYAAGRAGGRFAVRNSGANAVVEGCAANGCEYMTGGVVVILGRIGDNFAAGMTGGRAFVLDKDERFEKCVNLESVVWRRFSELDPSHEEQCRQMIEAHARETRSSRGQEILNDWARWRDYFYDVTPLETIKREQAAARAVDQHAPSA